MTSRRLLLPLLATLSCAPPPLDLTPALPARSPYAQELDLDDPLLHLRLPGDHPGALRLESQTASSFDGRTAAPLDLDGALASGAFTVELFARGASGCLVSLYGDDPSTALSLCAHGDTVRVSLGDDQFDTGALLAPAAWRHVALSWDGRAASIVVDGVPRWSHTPDAWLPPDDPTILIGARANCARGCPSDFLTGQLDELAWHDRALPAHRLLSHWLVARGARPASRPVTRAGSVTPQLGATDDLLALAVAPGGDLALTSSRDRVLRLWDLQARAQGRAFSAHEHAVGALAISPDRRLVFSGDHSGHANLWWLDDDTLHRALPGHAYRISSAAWSEDGLLVASGDTLGHVKIWDARDGSLVRSIPAPTRAFAPTRLTRSGPLSLLNAHPYVADLAFTPGASHLVVAYADGTIRRWPTRSGAAAPPLTVGTPLQTFNSGDRWDYPLRDDLLLSPDASHVVSTDGRANYTVHALPSGDEVGTITNSQVDKPLALLDDGRLIIQLAGDFDAYFDDPNSDAARAKLVVWDPRTQARRLLRLGDCVDATVTRDAILALCEDGLSSFPIRPGPPLPTLGLPSVYVTDVALLDRRLAFATDHAVHLWDLDALSPVATLPGGVRSLHASHPLKRVVARRDHTVDLIDPTTGAVTDRYPITPTREERDEVWAFAVARDAPVAAVGRGDGRAQLVSLRDGALLRDLGTMKNTAVAAALSADGRFAVFTGRRWAYVYDLVEEPDVALFFPIRDIGGVDALHVSDDGDHVLFGGGDQRAHYLEPFFRTFWSTRAHGMRTQTEIFSDVVGLPDGGWITAAEGRDLWRWTRDGGHSVLRGHSSVVNDLSLSRDGDLLASASADGTARVWNLAAPDTPSVAFLARGPHWAVFEDGGLFDTSADGAHLLAVSRGGRVEGVDRRAVELNRPDLLLGLLGADGGDLATHWRTRHEARRAREGYAADASASASLRLIEAREDAGSRAATFTARARADGDTLRAVQAYVDGVPAFPGDGQPASGDRARVELTLPLTSRDRVVELEAVTTRGARSPRVARALTTALPPEPRTLYLLAIGVSDYASPDVADLTYAAQDARDVAAFFTANPGPFDRVEARLLTDAQVTRASIADARAFTRRARPRDAVIVFVAGHGLHARDDAASYYLLTHDADLGDLATTAAPFSLIESLLDARVAARDKLALIDTCQSGEDPSPGRGMTAGESARGVGSAPLSTPRERALSTYGRRLIYRDLRRRTGAVVFSSSLGHELSLESDAWRNGAFTEALLEALSSGDPGPDGALSVSELRDAVTRRVPELTRGRQHPTVDRDNLLRDFTLATPKAPR